MSNICTNCGDKNWQNKKDFECPACGYKIVESTLQSEATLIFCSGCGCSFLDACTNKEHKDLWIKVKLPTVEKTELNHVFYYW